MSNLRYLKKSDGSVVLQEEYCLCGAFFCEHSSKEKGWQDIPTIEEPKQKKELWEVLKQAFNNSDKCMDMDLWKEVAQAAREYLEGERENA